VFSLLFSDLQLFPFLRHKLRHRSGLVRLG
jgi:hypothetical protein